MEDVRKLPKVEFVRKDDEKIIMDIQSKLSFIGIHYSDENYDTFTFKPKHVKITKPCLSWFVNLTTVKLLIYETYHEKLQSYFDLDIGKLKLHFMITYSFVLRSWWK